MITAWRDHDFSYGHRVFGHESKCRYCHGHNGRVRFHCTAPALDAIGRVIDFSIIKERLCAWIEREWDHRFLLWADDPLAAPMRAIDRDSVVTLPAVPTAENLALYLLDVVGPIQLAGTSVRLVQVDFYETRKCGVTVVVAP